MCDRICLYDCAIWQFTEEVLSWTCKTIFNVELEGYLCLGYIQSLWSDTCDWNLLNKAENESFRNEIDIWFNANLKRNLACPSHRGRHAVDLRSRHLNGVGLGVAKVTNEGLSIGKHLGQILSIKSHLCISFQNSFQRSRLINCCLQSEAKRKLFAHWISILVCQPDFLSWNRNRTRRVIPSAQLLLGICVA